jgi:hypothetical protein
MHGLGQTHGRASEPLDRNVVLVKRVAHLTRCDTEKAGGLGLYPAGFLHRLGRMFALGGIV